MLGILAGNSIASSMGSNLMDNESKSLIHLMEIMSHSDSNLSFLKSKIKQNLPTDLDQYSLT